MTFALRWHLTTLYIFWWVGMVSIFAIPVLPSLADSQSKPFLLGRECQKKSSYSESINHFDAAIAQNRQNSDAFAYRAVSHLKLQRYRNAISDAGEALRLNQRNLLALKVRIACNNDHLRNYRAALVDLNLWVKLAPRDPEPYFNRATLYTAIGEVDKALGDYSMARKINPQFGPAYQAALNCGICYAAKRLYPQALDNYNMALKLDPNKDAAYTNRGNVYKFMGEQKLSLANKQLLRENKQLTTESTKHYKQTQAEIDSLWQLALADYNRAIQINSGAFKNGYRESTYGNRALLYIEMNRYQDAIIDLDRAITFNPKNADNYLRRSLSYRQLGEYKKAVADANQALTLKPNLFGGFEQRIKACAKLGEYEQVLADFTSIGQLLYTSQQGRKTKSLERKDLNRALSVYDKILKLAPDNAESYYNRAIVYICTGTSGSAIKDLESFLSLSRWHGSSAVAAALLLNIEYRKLGQEKDAKKILDKASAQIATRKWPYPVLQYMTGEIQEAQLIYLASDKVKLTSAHYYLGMNRLLSGKSAQAIEQWLWVRDQGDQVIDEFMLSQAALDAARGS